ncbi:hypothetical protein GCM10010406_05060 [Streptomyces thermolineatus]|uniref:Uncharacterized protein n=1 Tax=Streptomyces thermolineatus TaxID=44033 RepID=A0ABP5Y1X2_9ACTN
MNDSTGSRSASSPDSAAMVISSSLWLPGRDPAPHHRYGDEGQDPEQIEDVPRELYEAIAPQRADAVRAVERTPRTTSSTTGGT